MLPKNRKSRKAIPGYTLIPKGEYYQIRKIGISGERVKTDPAYSVTRMFAKRFGKATRMGKIIRDAFLPQIKLSHTHRLLTAKLVEVLDTDTINDFGDRCFGEADFSPLVGFHFNPALPFDQIVKQVLIVEHKVSENQILVTIPAMIPNECIMAPVGSYLFRITIHCIGIHGKEMRTTLLQTKRRILPLGGFETLRKKIMFNMEAESITAYLVLASVNFHNKSLVKKQTGCHDKAIPLSVIEVIQPAR